MTLTHILIFSAGLLGYALVARGRGRAWVMLAVSVAAIYWLQPASPIRHLDFWLPTATIGLAGLAWAVTAPQPLADRRATLITAAVVAGLIAFIALLRYLGPVCCLTTSRPPEIVPVIAGLAIMIALAFAAGRWLNGRAWVWTIAAALLLALFVILKTEAGARAAAALLRGLNGQPPDLALAADIGWLGFSYVAFRLIHILRDRAAGKLPQLSLREFITYIIFFPAVTAGPIDRVERFVKDARAPFALPAPALAAAGQRLVQGVFKKFVLADTLALIALNAVNARQTTSAGWTWVLLYAYALRLWLDFSGYTDIALGLGQLLGVKLPENFNRPYLQPNLTQFWNNWHMTLAQWFRAYYFNPLTRALRSRGWPVAPIIFLTQLSTMVLIGLWHGVTWNFAAWGAWHGLGLFAHNRWADFTKGKMMWLEARPRLRRFASALGVLFTFHFVTLGWVWFALPDVTLARGVFLKLFGMG